MFSRSHLIRSVIGAIALGLSVNAASATVINIDFNIVEPGDKSGEGGHPAEPEAAAHFTGQGAYSDPGNDIWNSVRADHADNLNFNNPARGGIFTQDIFVGSLVDSTGAATGASVLVHADPEGEDTFALGFTDRGTAQLGRMAQEAIPLMRNQITALAGAWGQVTISGLEAGSLWDAYLYGAGGGSPHNTRFVIDGVVAETTGVTNDSNRSLTLGEDYVIISNVVAADGTIDILFRSNPDSGNANEGPFNGLQLVLVPEPASLALVSAGGLLLLRRRRLHA